MISVRDIKKAIVVIEKLKKVAAKKLKDETDLKEWKEQWEAFDTCIKALELAKAVEEFNRWAR